MQKQDVHVICAEFLKTLFQTFAKGWDRELAPSELACCSLAQKGMCARRHRQ